jgi:hypothetical protein
MSYANVGLPIIPAPLFPPASVAQLNAFMNNIAASIQTTSGNNGLELTQSVFIEIPESNVPVGFGIAFINGSATVPAGYTLEALNINTINGVDTTAYSQTVYCNISSNPANITDPITYTWNVTMPFLNTTAGVFNIQVKAFVIGGEGVNATLNSLTASYINFGFGPSN